MICHSRRSWEIFRFRSPNAMANVTIHTKKETVYDGPAPQSRQGTVYNGPSSAAGGGTVYDGAALKTGSAGGTVYGAPAAGGTVYNPRQAASRAAASAAHPAATKGAGIFFAIAIFSAINTALLAAGSPIVLGTGLTSSKLGNQGLMTAIVIMNIVVIGIFVLLGIAARSGSKAAFLIGMVLYGGDTALLLLSGHPEAHIAGIVVHGILLVGLFKAFSQMD
jgi:hypothetical protein